MYNQKIHYRDSEAHTEKLCLCGREINRKLYYTANPFRVTCAKCQDLLRTYLSLAEGDTVTNIYKKSSLFGKQGIVHIKKGSFCVAVTYYTGTYVYTPIEVQRHIKQNKGVRKAIVHYCIPIDKMPLLSRPGENSILCDKDNTMFLNRSLEHTEDVNKVTCTHCMEVINTAEFKTIMKENTMSDNTVVTYKRPEFQEFLLCKVDCAGSRTAMETFGDIPSLVSIKRNCQLNERQIIEALSGEDAHSLELFLLKPINVTTSYTYTVEEL